MFQCSTRLMAETPDFTLLKCQLCLIELHAGKNLPWDESFQLRLMFKETAVTQGLSVKNKIQS